MSDCGWIVQSASERNGPKRGSISMLTRALRSSVSVTSLTDPTRAPAIFTSWPGMRKPALSKIASTR
jgi:hypothetical protein